MFVTMLFLIFEKGTKKKFAPAILRLGSVRFLKFERGISKRFAPGMLRFVTMLYVILEK